jgi:hypothetical protein
MSFPRVFVFAAIVTVLFTNAGNAAPPLVLDKPPLEGEFKEADKKNVNGLRGWGTEFTVDLKAGQSLLVTATVIGAGRKVGFVLFDPTGKTLETTKWGTGANELKFGPVAATGQYTVVVISTQIGNYSITATDPTRPKAPPTEKELEEKIAKLKKELAEAEAELKKLKEKK